MILISQCIENQQIKWYGHYIQIENTRYIKQLFFYVKMRYKELEKLIIKSAKNNWT